VVAWAIEEASMSGQSARLASRRVEIPADARETSEDVRTIATVTVRRWRDSQQTSFPDFSTGATESSSSPADGPDNLELAKLKKLFF
jgi:hypothetical protein